MRLGVVSDIHGNLPALQAVLSDAGAVDGWINLGDTVSGPLWPRETAAFLMRQGWPTIAGNHERQLLTLKRDRMGASDRFAADALAPEQRDWLRALPPTLALAHGLVCVHGSPRSDVEYLLETVTPAGIRAATADELTPRLSGVAAELLLCGHSHLPRDVSGGGIRSVNPGSVGLQAYDDSQPWPHDVETGSPAARYAVIDHGAGGWSVALRTAAYDHAAAAQRAEANGRGDWADALRSGRVGRREADLLPLGGTARSAKGGA